MGTSIDRLRVVGLLEGASLILLVAVAMPLKYILHEPLAVRIVGWVHGALFTLYCLALVQAMREHGWSLGRGARLFIAALVPFGVFFMERDLREERRAASSRAVSS